LKKRAELLDRQGADVFGVQPDRLGIERIFLRKIDNSVGAVDALESKSLGQLVQSEKLAVVLGRPAEQA
jgi:hypothetical protein